MTLKQRSRKIAEALRDHDIIKEEDIDVVMKVVYSNMLYVRQNSIQQVKDILDEFGRKRYTETVQATVQAIIRRVSYL